MFRRERAGYVGLVAWLICIRLFFPLPGYFFGDPSAHALVDLVFWCMTILMIALGIWSSYQLIERRRPLHVFMFALALLIYATLRVMLDRFAYRELWDGFLAGNLGAVFEIVRQMSGLVGLIEMLVFLFMIPFVLVSVLALLLREATKQRGQIEPPPV